MRQLPRLMLDTVGGFNPRICKRCDATSAGGTEEAGAVSIHASVKDATSDATGNRTDQRVSIHASVKDATYLNSFISSIIDCFNPRICKRCDAGQLHILNKFLVSIHASVKDATMEAHR